VPLETAVARSRCHDGVLLPLVVRNCIDFVEECGLTVDGIYKSSGNKSRAQQLRKNYNNRVAVSFTDTDPVTVAGLLKLFLRFACHMLGGTNSDRIFAGSFPRQ
jgi:RalA-binding protein 1